MHACMYVCDEECHEVARDSYLNGGRAEGKQLISGSFGVAIHVD